jgi:hypothetical protein
MSSSVRGLLFLMLGVCGLVAGCSGAPDDADSSMEMPRLSSMAGPSGATGTNGLSTVSFNLYKSTLSTSTQSPLSYGPGSLQHTIQPTSSNNALLQSTAGREVLEYATRCALDEGDWVSGGSPSQTFLGGGLLTTTTGWRTSGLSAAQQEDLFTCAIAHLNFYDVHVPILLSGPSVTNKPGVDTSPYTFSEAVWITKITTGLLGASTLEFHVWPQVNLADLCGLLVNSTLGARICGAGLLCGLVVRTDFSTACQSTSNGWVCDGRPAIETKLTPQGAGLLHPLCGQ